MIQLFRLLLFVAFNTHMLPFYFFIFSVKILKIWKPLLEKYVLYFLD